MCRIFAEYVDIYIYTSIEPVYVSPKAVRTRPLKGIVCVAGDQPTEHCFNADWCYKGWFTCLIYGGL